MSCELEPAHPEGVLSRLGRQPDPWAWPDWTYAGELGTFDNRYDDPRGEYLGLYASSERLAPFLETLARFRADRAITSVEIAGNPRDEDFPTQRAGTIPQGWFAGRVLGTARCDAAFADVGHARSLAYLREALAPVVVSHGLAELDAAAIRAQAPRALTQEISRLGDDLTNWAICEPAAIEVLDAEELRRDDPDLATAIELFGLVLS
jgi:hypothetical protein